jgi:hypothetical protein
MQFESTFIPARRNRMTNKVNHMSKIPERLMSVLLLGDRDDSRKKAQDGF